MYNMYNYYNNVYNKVNVLTFQLIIYVFNI